MKKQKGIFKPRAIYVIVRRSFSEIEILDSFGFKKDATTICKQLELKARRSKKNNDYYEIHKSIFVGRRKVELKDLPVEEIEDEEYKIKF